MTDVRTEFVRVDVRLTQWLARYGVTFLRLSLGVVFLWFGVLKFFPGLSPAQELAGRTIVLLSGGLVGPDSAVQGLAILESVIGLGLLLGVFMRVVLLLLALQMLGTLTPLVLFPREVFTLVPFAPTLEGQYIIKNAVLISAAMVLGATVRGGGLVAQPEVKKVAEHLEGAEPLSTDETPARHSVARQPNNQSHGDQTR